MTNSGSIPGQMLGSASCSADDVKGVGSPPWKLSSHNSICVVCGSSFYGSPAAKRRCCSHPCRSVDLKARHFPTGKNGITITKDGYVSLWRPSHPNAMSNGYVLEHRMVMSDHLQRALTRTEVVHHKNHDRKDNRLENLELFSSNGEHKRVEHLRKTEGAW